MKKNILTIIILAATLINLTLIAVMLFVFMPTVKQTNSLITKVAQIIDLELESTSIKDEAATIDIGDVEPYSIVEELTINLAKDTSGKAYYAQVKASLSLNKKAEDYKKISGLMTQNEEKIKEIIIDEVSKLTNDEFLPNKDIAKQAMLTRIQTELFHSECVIGITFSKWVNQ